MHYARKVLFALFASILLLPAARIRAAGEEPFAGRWEGKEAVDGTDFPMALTLELAAGKLTGTLDFPDNGAVGLELADVKTDADELTAQYGPEDMRATLKLKHEGDKLTGTVKGSRFTATFTLARVANFKLPYTVEEVDFKNGEINLHGWIYVPKSEGKPAARRPGIVIIHGSGDSNRGAYGFYPDTFARLGIVALYYDKRGCGKSTGNWHDVGFTEYADDGIAGVHLLQSRSDVDPKNVGLWGISQAGWIMPIAAQRSKDVAYMIIVSGGLVTVAREGLWDVEYWFPRKGYSKEDIEQALTFIKLDNEVTRSGKGYEEAMAAWRAAKEKPWFKLLDKPFPPMPANNKSRNWYRRVMDIDHVPIVKSLTIPVIWFYGDNDNTFPAVEASQIVKKIAAEDKKDFAVHVLHDTGHGMRIPAKLGSDSPLQKMNPDYLNLMDEWVKAKVLARKP